MRRSRSRAGTRRTRRAARHERRRRDRDRRPDARPATAERLVGDGARDRHRGDALRCSCSRRYFYLRFKTDRAVAAAAALADPKLAQAAARDRSCSSPAASPSRAPVARSEPAEPALARARPRRRAPRGSRLPRLPGHRSSTARCDELRPRDDAYASIYYTLIGLHAAHVAAGVLLARLGAAPLAAVRRRTGDLTLQVTALYWHFVNVVAVFVFLTLYLAPRG